MHFKLNWVCSCCLLLRSCIGSLSMNCTSVSKQRFIIEIIALAVRITSIQSSSIIKKPLIIHNILISRLGLPQSYLLTYISLLFFYLLLSLCSNFFHSFLSLNFLHSMSSEFLSLIHLLLFILIIIIIFLNLLILLSSF